VFIAQPVTGSARPVAIYLRSATVDRDQLDQQRASIQAHAAHVGDAIGDGPTYQFVEGIQPLEQPWPELSRLITDVENGRAPFDRVYVTDFNRFGRDIKKCKSLLLRLSGNGVMIVSNHEIALAPTDSFHIPLETAHVYHARKAIAAERLR
jgi:Site-specific recombinases, DNA invertase Pin homologs